MCEMKKYFKRIRQEFVQFIQHYLPFVLTNIIFPWFYIGILIALLFKTQTNKTFGKLYFCCGYLEVWFIKIPLQKTKQNQNNAEVGSLALTFDLFQVLGTKTTKKLHLTTTIQDFGRACRDASETVTVFVLFFKIGLRLTFLVWPVRFIYFYLSCFWL